MLYSFMAFAGNIRRMFNMTAKMAAIFTYTYTSTVNLLSPRLFHFHLIHTFPLFSLCVCVYPPPPPSSFSLADCRCVNTCWKEVWQWARRWMQSRLVNNALWHSSVGECSVFCSALTPPPQKNVLFLPHPLDLDHVLSLAFVLSAWYLSIIIFMHWPPPPCLQPFWLLRSVLPERTAQACQRWFIPQLLAHANQFSCLCFDPLFAFFLPSPSTCCISRSPLFAAAFLPNLHLQAASLSVFLFLKLQFHLWFLSFEFQRTHVKMQLLCQFFGFTLELFNNQKKRKKKKKRCEMSTTTVENPVVIWWRELQFKAS